MVLVLGIVKASLEILGIGIGVKKVVLLMSDHYYFHKLSLIMTRREQILQVAKKLLHTCKSK